MIFSTGMVYDGEFVNGVICGEGEMRYNPTCKYQGSWINGLVSRCSYSASSLVLFFIPNITLSIYKYR